jgi:hypothetical protein
MPEPEQVGIDKARHQKIDFALEYFEETLVRIEPTALLSGHAPRRIQLPSSLNQ